VSAEILRLVVENGTEKVDGKVVLEDLLRYCGWGPQDPTVMNGEDAKSILAMQRIVWRIKAMLNSTVETKQGDDNE